MPDITMCNSLTCTKRMKCYRWIAKADPIQSFSKFSDCNEQKYFLEATQDEINDYLERERNKYGRNSESSEPLSE